MASRLKQIPESLLVRLWQERATREETFRAGNGRRFKILYPGRVGTTAGPDFREAVLEEEGVGLVRGDVEIHVRQRDWEAHGHGKDPRYNGVVLHVVAEMESGSTKLQNGGEAPVLTFVQLLCGRPSADVGFELWSLLEPHGYCAPGDATELGALLDHAGDSRFQGRSRVLRSFLKEDDPEQVLYESLMEALGYSQNQEAFVELAGRVPYQRLRKLAVGLPSPERLLLLTKLLLAAAGFSPNPADEPSRPPRAWSSASPEGKVQTSRLSRSMAKGPLGQDKSMGLGSWHLFRVRPQNHPRRRIIEFAQLLELLLPSSESIEPGEANTAGEPRRAMARALPWAEPAGRNIQGPSDPCGPCGEQGARDGLPPWAGLGLVEGMACLVKDSARRGGARGCVRVLEEGLLGVYQPSLPAAGVGGAEGTQARMGRGRVRDMVVNSVLPFLHALAQMRGDAQLEQLSLEIYCGYPKLQENELTREMRRQLLSRLLTADASLGPRSAQTDMPGRYDVVTNARRQQGLLHLHHLIASPVTTSVRGQSEGPFPKKR